MKKVYTGDNNWVFDTTVNIENELMVGSINSAANEMYWKLPKEHVSLLPHDGGTPHPTNPLMVKNGGNHIVTRGCVKTVYTWTEEDNLDVDHLRNYAHYVDSVFPEEENIKEFDLSSNGYFKLLWAVENGEVSEFTPLRPQYRLRADFVGYLTEGSSALCVLRTDPNADEWFTTYRDVQPGDTVTLEPVGTKTYVMFGSSLVQKEGQTLQLHKPYKVTREVEVTCPEFTIIVRVHQK